MSAYDSIKQLLSIQDPHIFIEEISKKVINEKVCLFVMEKLTYAPPNCSRCETQCMKNGYTCSNILLLKSAGQPETRPSFVLKSNALNAKIANTLFWLRPTLVRPFHQISTPIYHKMFNLLLRRRSMTEIAFDFDVSVPTVIWRLNQVRFSRPPVLPEVLSLKSLKALALK